jgi:hypothetical protein
MDGPTHLFHAWVAGQVERQRHRVRAAE